eukprot:NODE_476_length_7980_cov_0.328258.p1 type:complete len:356 gc:universal NODE_476_length_7980_cov_0.328258:6130-5063(-)
MSTVGWLYISALKGVDLKIKGITSSPAIRFQLDYVKKTTKPDKKNKVNPTFTEVFEFEILEHHSSINIEVIGKSMSDETVFGRSLIELTQVKNKRKAEFWVQISHPTKKKDCGKVLVKMEYITEQEKKFNDGEMDSAPSSNYSSQKQQVIQPRPNYSYNNEPHVRGPLQPGPYTQQTQYASFNPRLYDVYHPDYNPVYDPSSPMYNPQLSSQFHRPIRPAYDTYRSPYDPRLHDPRIRPRFDPHNQRPPYDPRMRPAPGYYPSEPRMRPQYARPVPQDFDPYSQGPPQRYTPRPNPPPQHHRPSGPPQFRRPGANYYRPPSDEQSINSDQINLPRPSYTPRYQNGPYGPRPGPEY